MVQQKIQLHPPKINESNLKIMDLASNDFSDFQGECILRFQPFIFLHQLIW